MTIDVRIAWSASAQEAHEHDLRLPAGATVADAVAAWRAATGETMDAGRLGIWGRRTSPQTVLAPGDRVEIYRPLNVDPMEARRARQRRQRAAATCSRPR